MKISSLIIHYYTVSTQYLHAIYTVSTHYLPRCGGNCTRSVLTRSSGRRRSCAWSGGCCCSGPGTSSGSPCTPAWSVAWPHLVTIIHSLFQTLFQQSTNNGFKNTAKNEKKNIELIAKIKLLEGNIKCLKNEAIDLREEIVRREKISKRDSEHRLKMRRQTCDAIHKANLQLKRQIEAIKQNKNNVGGKHL